MQAASELSFDDYNLFFQAWQLLASLALLWERDVYVTDTMLPYALLEKFLQQKVKLRPDFMLEPAK